MTKQTINVANASELNNALSNATGGETILLASGNYGTLNLNGSQFASTVTIKSADGNATASFSEAYMNNASNLTFDTVKFDYTYSSGEGDAASKFSVENSSHITFTSSIFEGDLANGAGTGKGLVVRGSTNVDVIDSEFHSWWKAVGFTTSDNVNLIGNNIHSIRSDGVNLGRVQNVLVENNYIHDFGGLGGKDHRDMIQIQRSSGDGSSDVTIRNNIMDIGSGDYTQGIWAGGDKANASDLTNWHKNITVQGNVMYNAHTNGIAIHMTDGLTISENTLLAVPRAKTGGITVPKINVSSNSKNVVIEKNVTSTVVGDNGQSDWTVQKNAIVQNTDPNAPGFYGKAFIQHATTQADGYNHFEVAVGSAADQMNAGSNFSKQAPFSYDAWVGATTSSIPAHGTSGGAGNAGSGNAGGSVTPGPVAGAGGTAPDASGNGGTAPTAPVANDTAPAAPVANDTAPTAPVANDTAPAAPVANDTAPAAPAANDTAPAAPAANDTAPAAPVASDTAPAAPDSGSAVSDVADKVDTAPATPDAGGAVDTGTSVDATPAGGTSGTGSDVYDDDGVTAGSGSHSPMTFDDFVLDIAGLPKNNIADFRGDAAVIDTGSGAAIHFDGDKDHVKLGRLAQFENSEQIAFNVEFERDEADGSSQRLVWNHRKIGLTLTDDGLVAHVRNNDDPFHKGFRVDNLGLNDTEKHTISVMVDQDSDRLQVIVDDQLVLDETNTDFDFVGADGQEWGWNIGTGQDRYVDGEVSGFAIDDDVHFLDQPIVHDDLFA